VHAHVCWDINAFQCIDANFRTYALDFNSFELLMNDLHAFKNQPIKIKRISDQAIDVYIIYLCCEYQLI
jgi:hypothetical protein